MESRKEEKMIVNEQKNPCAEFPCSTVVTAVSKVILKRNNYCTHTA